MLKSVLLSIVTILILSLVPVIAQDAVDTPNEERVIIETKDKDGPVNKGLKLEKAIRPRLPNGFGPIVNPAQKEKIYSIQSEYNPLIAMLELRITLLKMERDAKIETVLTPNQLEKIRSSTRRTPR